MSPSEPSFTSRGAFSKRRFCISLIRDFVDSTSHEPKPVAHSAVEGDSGLLPWGTAEAIGQKTDIRARRSGVGGITVVLGCVPEPPFLAKSRLPPPHNTKRHLAYFDAGGGSGPKQQILPLALPKEVEHWSLTTLREKLIKIGAKVVLRATIVGNRRESAGESRLNWL